MRPDLIDYISFILLTAGLLIARRFAKILKNKRRKLSTVPGLSPTIERPPTLCKLCPIRGVCNNAIESR
ncbi:hypothetical protein [Lentzea guizhouensis]|uniref:hypothetical protein n=1 Tax=Lentzea guizhouensis TaxID=1586287 RepID=UPI0012B68615|nr:hypothetical protein [Lentzea guizhouensis]